MASSEQRIGSNENGISFGSAKAIIEFSQMETALKTEKARAKSDFTRAQNTLSSLMEDQESRNRPAIQDALYSLGKYQEFAMETMARLSELYVKHGEMDKNRKVIIEIDKIEDDFSTTSEAARKIMDFRRNNTSCIASGISAIVHQNSSPTAKTYPKKEIREVRTECPNTDIDNIEIKPSSSDSRRHEQSAVSHEDSELRQQLNIGNNCSSVHETTQTNDTWLNYSNESKAYQKEQLVATGNREVSPIASIEQDMWRQLKKVQIPVFSGDKRKYQSWKAAFLSCIDNAPATGEYKLLQLRQYLSGEALQAIENLGHSANAYVAAKDRLERKYGGRRRQIAIYLEELDQFPQVRLGSARDLERFPDLLDIAIINLQETGQHQELGEGLLYAKLQQKLPEAMLAQYHRWIYENNKSGSVLVLRTWVIQESDFMTIASETVNGFAGKVDNGNPAIPKEKYGNQRTFFGETNANHNINGCPCKVCGENHDIWSCAKFIQQSVPGRWNIAKQCQLCFRCLAEGHHGKSCKQSQHCGINCCQKLHHRMLHKCETTRPQLCKTEKIRKQRTLTSSASDATCLLDNVTEGKYQTRVTEGNDGIREFTGLRTVPVLLKNGDLSMKVNALLDDASTQTYVNSDVAVMLGLTGQSKRVTVNVLNDHTRTFITRPTNVELKSVDGDVNMKISAYTADRITGNMAVVDWNKFKIKWPHLRNINFPRPATRPIVDVLIGLDCAELHCALQEVRGRPGEPAARLTPLGWTCTGTCKP